MPETQASSTSAEAASDAGGDILARIVATKLQEIAQLRPRREELRSGSEAAPPPRDFLGALRRGDTVSLIAEVKRRSPGAGPIRTDLDPVELAADYEGAGASALSVLTDQRYFGGSLEDLSRIRDAVAVPVLRKDFIMSEEQVWEARGAGADAILLIVRILEDGRLEGLRALAEGLGMEALVEAHDGAELRRGLRSGARLIGINNRNLATFRTSLETTLDLLPTVPEGVTLVSESGIGTREEVEQLGAAGVDAILVGEALLRAPDPGAKARHLSGVERTSDPRMRARGQGAT